MNPVFRSRYNYYRLEYRVVVQPMDAMVGDTKLGVPTLDGILYFPKCRHHVSVGVGSIGENVFAYITSFSCKNIRL